MSEMNDKVIAIGIDPGKDGALAVLWPKHELGDSDFVHEGPMVCTFDRERYRGALTAVLPHRHDYRIVCVVEHVGAMPGQGCVSMFHFGENFGWLQGMLFAYNIPYELVRPQKWKKMFSCTSDKNTSIEVAQRLFPGIDLRRTPKCKGPHDGTCEALLMAEYGRRVLA